MSTTRARTRNGPAPEQPTASTLDPSRCTCQRPTLIATFQAEQLVALELRHLRTRGCAYPAQPIDVETWRRPW